MVRLTGRQSTNYQGVQASSPPDFSVHNRIPTPTDWQNFYLGDLWEVSNPNIPQDQFVYILVSLRNNIANWVRFAGGNGNLVSLTGNTGGAVFGDVANNVNTIGDGTTIIAAGNPGTHTITFSIIGGRAAQSFIASPVTTPIGLGGTATPIVGVINVQSNHNLNVSAGLPNTGAANDIVYWTTNTSTWGDLVNVTAGNFSIQAFTGDITVTANNGVGNFNFPNTTGTGNAGIINVGGNRYFSNFGTRNLFFGRNSGNTTNTIADDNVGIGENTFQNITSAFNNTSIGSQSMVAITSGSDNTAIGTQALASLTTGTSNCAMGAGTLANLTTGLFNTAIGTGCLVIGNGSSNTVVGFNGMVATTAGTNNSALGNAVMITNTTGSHNVAMGYNSLHNTTTGSSNVAIGENSGINYVSSESNNINIGTNSFGRVTENNIIRIQTGITTGDNNIFIGQGSIGLTYIVATANNNTGVGSQVLNSLTTGANNSVYGFKAGLILTTGGSNALFGSGAGLALTTGTTNTFLGTVSGNSITTGTLNILLGNASGLNYTGAESNNIIVANNGVLGESNTIRIGVSGGGAGQQNRCFIAGIRGITTGVNDAIAVLIDSAGQLGTVSSSMRYKDNIQDMFHHSIDIYNLRPVIFNYKEQDKISYGLIAEEVEDVMPNLVVYNDKKEPETVKYLDLIPMLLNEIQQLNKRIDYLEKGMKHVKFNL